tara:strand:- start:4794 stop:6761 length:1968 start_codon:yes stop_codon:yes gene_type:complete
MSENQAESSLAMSRSGVARALMVIVLLVCTLTYSVALSGPLFFDDVPNLLANNLVQIDGTEWDDWRVAALSSEAGILLRPVAMMTFALNHVVAGEFSALSLKTTNLVIHLVNGLLVYLFAQALLSSPALRRYQLNPNQQRNLAILAAAIWMLHPIHVSTVLYVIQRMAQLSTLFTLAGLLVFVRYRLRWAEFGAGIGELLSAALWLVLLGLLALLSKENGALLFWLMLVVEVILFRGIWRGHAQRWLIWLGWIAFIMPVLLVVALYLLSPEMLLNRFDGRNFNLYERLLTQGRTLWQYLSWMLVPNVIDMGFFHDDIPVSHSLFSPRTTLFSLLAWAVVVAASLLFHRRYPLIAFAFLFYLVAHSMESTVIPLEMVFEHRNYLPSIGFAVLASVGVFRCVASVERLRLRTAVGGLLGLMTVLLLVRTTAWSDELKLARFNVVNHPQSARANFFYANALYKRFEQATALGLDEEEQRALAVTSRGYFERMHSIDEHAFAATVMLYQLDAKYFPGLAQDNDWLAAIARSLETHRLQSSDTTALRALVDFSLMPQFEAERSRVGYLLEQLGSRYPNSLELLALQYRFVIGAEPTQKARVLPMLERAVKVHPGSRQASSFLAQYHSGDDLTGTYEAMREWLRRDQLRRELPVVREIFNQ